MCGMPDPKHCCLDIEIGVIQEFCIHWIDSCIEFFHPRYSFGTCFLQIAPPNMSNLRIHTVGRHHAIADTHVNTFLWSTWKFWFETLESRLTWVVSNASDVWWWKKTAFESSKICGAKWNYTSIDPKQFTGSKFRLKPVILISECFCSRCGHTNQHPPPTWRETTGDNGRQRETRPLQSPRSRPHQPTPTPHMKGNNRRQRETRPLQSLRWRPHQPTPTPHMKGDNRTQRETTGDKTTSEPKKPTTPTNTRPPHEGRQPETMGDNGRQDHFRAQEADHTNQHPPPTWRETTGDNGRQDHFRA